jgi:hypothetical protein
MRVPEKRKLTARYSLARSARVAVALALLGLLCSAAAASAAAGQPRLFLGISSASPGDHIAFTLSTSQGDTYSLAIGDQTLNIGDPISGSDPPQWQTSGQDTTGDGISDYFTMPDLGNSDETVTVEATINRDGQNPILSDRTMHYLAAVPAGSTSSGTTTGPTASGATTPAGNKAPAAINRGATGKNGSGKKHSSSGTGSDPTYVAPYISTPSTGGGSNQTSTPTIPSTPTPPVKLHAAAPAIPAPVATPPPGVAGAPGITAPPSVPPGGAAPIAPVASHGNGNGAKLDVPAWLVALLGLFVLASIGGAEARLLGVWTTPKAISRSPDEARLLALKRASSSGATLQQGIATRKGTRANGGRSNGAGSTGAAAGKNGSKLKV